VKKISYEIFWQQIHARADKESIPLRVMFELTYDCNFRCQHCYIPRSYRARYRKLQLKTKQIFGILDRLKAAGCLFLGFTGGEPFMRPDILEILEYAKKQGFQTIIYTNGSLLDRTLVRRLAKINPNKIDITIPGMSQAVFESITGVAGSHKAVFEAIGLLRKHKIPLGFKSCLLRENGSEIAEIKKFARSLNAPYRLDTLLSYCLNGSSQPYKFRGQLPAVKGVKRNTGKAQVEYDCSQKEQKSGTIFFCGVGRSQAAITPAGELKFCVMIGYPKYDLLKLPFPKAWEKVKALASDIQPDKTYLCPECQLQAYCRWCPARGWLYRNNFRSCDPQMRAWAKRLKKEYADQD
jgi:radical SAM protein with 4Fe4S-binding SPASM domain